MSKTRLTKFEIAQVISTRMEQLARGAEPVVPVDDIIARASLSRNSIDDIRLVATREFESGLIPFDLIRKTSASSQANVRLGS